MLSVTCINGDTTYKEQETLKETNLLHSSEKSRGVEKAAQPERAGSAVEAPRVKLVVTVVQLRQPVTETARLPRYLPGQPRLISRLQLASLLRSQLT